MTLLVVAINTIVKKAQGAEREEEISWTYSFPTTSLYRFKTVFH